MLKIILRFHPICALALLTLAAGPAWAQEAKKVSQAEALKAAVSRVQPDYPAHARQLKIEGVVELQVLIAENGTVEKVEILSGNPVLTRAAVSAFQRWKFTPFTEDGKPVKAVAPMSVNFKL
jgi:TonB family protein